jgi:nitrite reductase/ring-hydroxylating ferredoxin subunit
MMTTLESWVAVCRLDELSGEGMYPFEVGAKRLAVYVVGDRIHATDNVCSHAFALLTDGWLEDGLVECPLHGAQFDVTTGAVVRGPADCPVATFETRLRDGFVEVRIEDEP